MALTIDFTSGVGSGFPWDVAPKVAIRKQVVSLSDARVIGTLTGTDTYQALDIPAGELVLAAWFDVDVADDAGNSGTVSLGDTDAVNTWVTAATVAAIAAHWTAAKPAKLYPAGDILKLVVATGALAAKTQFTVYAVCVQAP